MDRKEAIATLEDIKQFGISKWIFETEDIEAFDMAIEALKGGDAKMQTVAKTPDYMQQSRHDDGKDLISRADAIEAVANAIWHYPNECYYNLNDFDMAEALAKDALSALPSAEAVQGEWKHKPSKSGEWVWWQCSECGAVIYSETEADRKIHHAYCGVCGARMKGGAE